MIDLLITNGMVIDGTGSPGFFAAVAVEGDRVSIHRGDVSGLEAARTIDASGMWCALGSLTCTPTLG